MFGYLKSVWTEQLISIDWNKLEELHAFNQINNYLVITSTVLFKLYSFLPIFVREFQKFLINSNNFNTTTN